MSGTRMPLSSPFRSGAPCFQGALGRAQRFELHCWKDECSWTRLALGYGSLKPVEWEGGVVVEGPVTDAFRHMLLTLERPTDREAHNKFTPFFSIVLDGRAFRALWNRADLSGEGIEKAAFTAALIRTFRL